MRHHGETSRHRDGPVAARKIFTGGGGGGAVVQGKVFGRTVVYLGAGAVVGWERC